MKFHEFLTKWQGYMLLHPEERKGQALLNCLHFVGRDNLYTNIDDVTNIFYNDEKLNEAIILIAANWD